jgi:hypothetical protein
MAAALSLKCDQCGVKLRSIKEAQDHGDATGHSAFSESTEAVRPKHFPPRRPRPLPADSVTTTCAELRAASYLPPAQVKRLVCRECGKVCRNSDEWDLHSKRTGHAACDDKVGGGGLPAGTAEPHMRLAPVLAHTLPTPARCAPCCAAIGADGRGGGNRLGG